MKRKRQPDIASDQPGPARRARRIQTVPRGADVIEGTGEAASQATSKSTQKQRKAPRQKDEERRLRAFRSKPPQTYLVKLDRARTQRLIAIRLLPRPSSLLYNRQHANVLNRLFVLRRTRGGTEEVPEEYIDIAGSTGNIYQVVIGKEPSCTCPDAKKGNQCKHVVYVGLLILKENHHIIKSLS